MTHARIILDFDHDLSGANFQQLVDEIGLYARETSRVSNVKVTVDSGHPTPGVVVSGTWITLAEGRVEAHKNEISIVSTVSDPSGLRLASSSPEPTLGHFSGNALRSDGRQEMVAYLLFKRWEPMRHLGDKNYFGGVEVWLRDPRRSTNDDQQFVKCITFEPDGIHLYMPVRNHWTGAIADETFTSTSRARRATQRVKEKAAKAQRMKKLRGAK